MSPPRHGFALFALAGLLAWTAPSAAQPARGKEVEAPEVRKLRFRGVKAVDKDELRQSIATEASGCKSFLFRITACLVTKSRAVYERQYLDREEFTRDVVRLRVFYWKRGYREAQVDTTVRQAGRGKVDITFTIVEGPPTVVRRVDVTRPATVLTDREVRRLVLVRAGKPLSLLALDSSVVRLRNALFEKGYADAQLAQSVGVSQPSREAAVEIVIDPKWKTFVGEVLITGNDEVSNRTIQHSLSFTRGDLFRLSDITRSQRALYESGLFTRASVELVPGSDSVKTVAVKVIESPPQEARAGGGFSTLDFVQVEGRYTHYNWLGNARRLDIQGALGNLFARQLKDSRLFSKALEVEGSDASRFLVPTWQASADVRERWVGDPRNSIGLSVFAHRRSSPGIVIDRGYGTSATFTREVALRAPASANYRFEITTIEAGDVYFCVNFGVCDLGTIGALRRQQRLSPFALTATVDRTNDPFSPSQGYVARVEAEHASGFTLSDFRYNRAYADAAAYRRIGRRAVLAGHVKAGWVAAVASGRSALGVDTTGIGILHPRKRFYAGGSQSVRGYGENQLGPRVLTIPALRLRGDSGERCADPDIRRCDPNADGLFDRDFQPRPLGGNRLLEGSAEFRFPVWGPLVGAVFVDGAIVGSGESILDLQRATAAVTPGIGMRYKSPVGPIRVDLGLNPALVEDLPVVTESEDGRLVTLRDASGRALTRRYSSVDRRGGFRGALNRMQLHLSIGEAF